MAQAKFTWKKKEAKSRAMIDSDDDASGSSGKKRAPSTTGFNKPHRLSPALSQVVGADIMSRPQLTKQLWVYIKANNLQDPNDGRAIIPDQRLAAAFGSARFTSKLPRPVRQPTCPAAVLIYSYVSSSQASRWLRSWARVCIR